ncbi:MAG: bifunctional chorismate mutase/prephenate dehydratase [Oligosphaeraceae bacterium]|nr:bifunctional chorismate mutase/prephenate dehydratase [Oligosphaeraceae bacterium]
MEIAKCRKKIDQIDDQLIRLFNERMEISRAIGECKREQNIPVLNPGREREVLRRVAANSSQELRAYSQVLFRMLFDLSRSYQHRLASGDGKLGKEIRNAIDNTAKIFPKDGTVACQGIEGAYSQLAAERLFPLGDVIFFNNFAGVFQAVEKNLCKYGMLPIENSLHGTVAEVYDLMRNHKFYILRSVKMQINHVLLGLPGSSLNRIKEIYSHEQALWQCGSFLKNLPGVKLNVCENTAVAARKVAESGLPEIAAISSENCARLYGLHKLRTDIQNSDCNYTRFICIGKEMGIYPGADRISIMVSVSHEPGALYRLIAKFAALGINLLKLESRPVEGRDFEFLFYLDFESSLYSPEIIQLLNELAIDNENFVFLGGYNQV